MFLIVSGIVKIQHIIGLNFTGIPPQLLCLFCEARTTRAQDAFYSDGSVLFFSTHQYPWYPGTGAKDERGEGKGSGLIINCPFDEEYRPLFEAMVFAISDCGFVVRSAMEVDDGSQVRIDKIANIIAECRLGIHDISRTELDPVAQLPRFNMPLELGMFLGAKRYGNTRQRQKICLILDRERYRYQRFCSDIAGQDIRTHDNDPAVAVRVVRDWLRNALVPPAILLPSGSRIARRYAEFQADLPLICELIRLDPDELTFNDLTSLISVWLQENGW